MIPFRDDPCPARGPSLAHYAEYPDYVCADCEAQCLIEAVLVNEAPIADDGDVVMNLPVIANIGERECIVDHGALTSPMVLGDDGLRWSHCPNCNTQVEPKFAQGAPAGASWGPGRTGSPRQQTHDQQVWAYMRWFYVESGRVEP